jgi:putative ATP-dependent endonuclease of the OLD family
MLLAQIEVENFKGLNKATFEPGHFSCLVGENNAGKSSVLQAIAYILNRPNQLQLSLYYDPSKPVIFRGYFTGVTSAHLDRLADEHRQKLSPLVIEEKVTLVLIYQPQEKLEIRVIRSVPIDSRYADAAIDNALKGLKGNAIREAVSNEYPEFLVDFPVGTNLTGAKDYLRTAISKLDCGQFQMSEVPLPSGIASSISNLIPEAIYIPAVKNLNDDLKTTQSTSFGRLLGLLLEDMTDDLVQVEAALTTLHKMFNRTYLDGKELDERNAKVRSLEILVEEMLGENFPLVKVEIEVPPPELKAILNSAQIFVNDGSRDAIDQKGDGIKRSLTFALLRAYVTRLLAASSKQSAASRPLVFLFEEPELYLHPRAQRILFGTLASISNTYQVVVTTHSPIFFQPGITAVFVRVAKMDASPKPISTLFPVNFVLDKEKAETFRLAQFDHAEAGFFSRCVVLFEGESDDAFISHVAKVIDEKYDFAGRNVALVRVSGKGNFAKYRTFFESFGIQVKIVADLDALLDGFEHLGAPNECSALRSGAIRAVDERIAALNLRATLPGSRIKKKVQEFAWKNKYESARAAADRLSQGIGLTAVEIDAIQQIFRIEENDTRLEAIRTDKDSRDALIPLLDKLRENGICVLSRGAIEEYYPEDVEQSGSKPQRALRAAAKITCAEEAAKLCSPLTAGRQSELHEIFTQLFATPD